MNETSKIIRNKATLNASVSPSLKRELEELVETDDFASLSDIVAIACQDFLTRYTMKREAKLLIDK